MINLEGRISIEGKVKTIKEAYKSNLQVAGFHLSSWLVAAPSAYYFSSYSDIENSVILSIGAGITDSLTYWTTFLSQKGLYDALSIRKSEGILWKKKFAKKIRTEYTSMVGIIELAYLFYRVSSQYVLQNYFEFDPGDSSILAQSPGILAGLIFMPILCYKLEERNK